MRTVVEVVFVVLFGPPAGLLVIAVVRGVVRWVHRRPARRAAYPANFGVARLGCGARIVVEWDAGQAAAVFRCERCRCDHAFIRYPNVR